MQTIGAIVSLLLAAPTRADDWPQWRGPHRDSIWHETGILDSFPSEGLKVLWRVPIGNGFSSPCIAQGRVFVTYSQVTRTAANENVLCVDAATGKTIWSHTYPVNYPEWGANPDHPASPVATPVVADGKVYTLGRMSNLICLDAITGRVIWQHDLPKEFGTTEDLRGFNCSPIVEGNLVIMAIAKSPQVSLIAFDKDSGRQVWESLDEIPSDSSPIVITSAGRRQLIVWAYKSVAALDPANSEILWRQAVNTGGTYAVSTPVWKEDRLLIGGIMLQLASDKPGASILWPAEVRPSRVLLSQTSTALVQDGFVFTPTSKGQLCCLEAVTGKQLWQVDKVTESTSGASIHLTAAPSIHRVFLYTDRGDLILSQLTAEGYKELSRAHLIEPTSDFSGRKMAWSPPSYANRCVFVRNDKEMVCASLSATPLASDH
ncbi:outer membrane protein assembly factor BamB family protein [Verrucomicrobiota bacterium sgz303538]